MGGLLDFLNTDQGRMGLGLLAAAGPRSDGAGFGQRLQEGMGQFDAYKANALKQQMLQAQMQQAMEQAAQQKADRARQQTIQQGMGQFFKPGQQALSPLMGDAATGIMPSAGREAVAPSFDTAGAAQFLAQNGEYEKALPMLQSLQPKEYTLSKGQKVFKNGQVVMENPDEPSLPTEAQEFLFGQKNPAFNDWKQSMKKAGATNVSTRIENKMGESLAGQVGPMVKDTYTQAQGAVQQADAANRIIKAVDGGKIIAGPLAGGRMKVAQIGQMLGVSGRDDAEIISRSRDVIRGLSELTLQGRKQMTGQGAITESESKLAEKAMSGDISDLTPAEIKQLASASARVAKFNYDNHQSNLQNLQQDPGTAGLAKFYKVAPFPNMQIQQPANPAGGGVINFGDLK